MPMPTPTQNLVNAVKANSIQDAKTIFEEEHIEEPSVALPLAAKEGYEDMTKFLLEKGAKPDYKSKNGGYALIAAASNGHNGVVDILLDAGATVDIIQQGSTPLVWAATNGYAETVKLLLQRGADPHKKCPGGKTGKTALEWARHHDQDEVVSVLEEYTAKGQVVQVEEKLTQALERAESAEKKLAVAEAKIENLESEAKRQKTSAGGPAEAPKANVA